MLSREWIRDRSLGLFFLTLFLVSWIGQLVVEWFDFRSEEADHGQPAAFWSSDFWLTFWQSTLENWQSEFLQLSAFVIAAAYFVYKGSAESEDSEQRLEAKLDALLRESALDPEQIELRLPAKYHALPEEREARRRASRVG